MEKPQCIAIIGHGRAGSFLAPAFRKKGYKTDVYSRHPEEDQLPLANYPAGGSYFLTLLCVPDMNIATVSSLLPETENIIAHISGATPIGAIDSKHPKRGVFYPVMSLTGNANLPLSDIPLCLESSDKSSLDILKNLAENLGCQYYLLNSLQRRHLHLAAVLAHNFSNHLYHLAYEELQKAGMDMYILKPLLEQNVKQLEAGPPQQFQTGPAVRRDEQTIERHLQMLKDHPLQQQIYQLITKSIQNKDDEKL